MTRTVIVNFFISLYYYGRHCKVTTETNAENNKVLFFNFITTRGMFYFIENQAYIIIVCFIVIVYYMHLNRLGEFTTDGVSYIPVRL